MFGPDLETTRSNRAGRVTTGPGFAHGFSQGVQGQARAFVTQGLDFAAIALLTDHLKTSPDDAWASMFAVQLCLRARTSHDGPNEASEALLNEARANLARLDRENRLPPIDTGSNYTNWFIAGWAAWAAGDEPRARETFLAGLAQNRQQTVSDSVGRLYDGACFLALAGDTDAAVARIERLAEIGYTNAQWLSRDPDLQPLHADPRFFAAIDRIRAAQEQALQPAEQDPLGTDDEKEPVSEPEAVGP